MKKRIRNWFAVPILALGVFSPANASVTCLAPEPVCVTVLIGGLIMGMTSADEDRESQEPQIENDDAALKATVDDLQQAGNEGLADRIVSAARHEPGYATIVKRYEQGRIEGHESLASLMDSRSRMFDDLDRLAILIDEHNSRSAMAAGRHPRNTSDGRINWGRYAALARQALVIHDSFLVRDQATPLEERW